MKKIVLTFLIVLSLPCFAQKCKVSTEIDKFTNVIKTQSKQELIWKDIVSGLAMFCKGIKINNHYIISFVIRDYDIFSISKGDEAWVLFTDKSVLKLKCLSDVTATSYQAGSEHRWELSAWYPLSDEDYDKLTTLQVEAIRIHGFKTLISKEIKSSNSSKIATVLNCVR